MSDKRAHFPALDGARGIAAVCVFLYHIKEYFGGLRVLESSFLAVDLFFLMSGFVIALSYEQSLISGTRSLLSFIWTRVLRLYPLYLMACCIGATYFLMKQFAGIDDAPTPGQIIDVLPATLLLAPWPSAVEWGFTPYPFAPSAWSLSFEFWYNILYALLAVRLGTRALLAIIAISLAVLLHQAGQWGTLDMGWSTSTALGGSARFWFSFSIGVVIFRHFLTHLQTARLPFYLSMLCFAFVALPKGAVEISTFWVTVVFPLAFMAGGAYQIQGAAAVLCNHLGRLSYGIYILHAPIVLFQTGVAKVLLGEHWENHKPMIGFLIVVTVLVVSWIGTYHLDEPLRRYLKNRVGKRRSVGGAPTLPV